MMNSDIYPQAGAGAGMRGWVQREIVAPSWLTDARYVRLWLEIDGQGELRWKPSPDARNISPPGMVEKAVGALRGAAVREPKTPRGGHPNALRVDLQKPDSASVSNWVVAERQGSCAHKRQPLARSYTATAPSTAAHKQHGCRRP